MVDLLKFLEDIGLSNNEARAYVALLELGSAPAGRLAHAAKVNRTLTYALLESLVEKGFASYSIRNNVKFFSAAPPERIIGWLQEKTKRAEEMIAPLKKLRAPPEEENAEIFRGLNGFRTVVDALLREGADWYTLGFTGAIIDLSPSTFEYYERKRVKAGIKRFIITTRDKKPLLSRIQLTRVRYLPKEYLSPASTVVCGDKVGIFMPYKHDFTMFLFESKPAASTYKKYFELLWRFAKTA